jgi:hypothetical protein
VAALHPGRWEVTATSKHYQAVSPRGTVITLSRGKMSPRAVADTLVRVKKDERSV